MLCKPSNQAYSRFTLKMALEIAAPHTWPAAIMPTLIATCCAAATDHVVSVSASLVCLVIVILMQSAVNTFNDYYDFVKGTDSESDNVDPSDAVLVYNNVNPKSALRLALGFLAVAFALGVYIIYRAGFIPLIIALIGALFVVVYSAGKTPISYLPLGEFVSGFVMGGLIPLAVYMAITLRFDWLALLWSLPSIIGIGLIMFTNNTCDIERDTPAKRKTLSVLLGRDKARKLYHVAMYAMVVLIIAIVAAFFTSGLLVIPFMLLAGNSAFKALKRNPLTQATRMQAMPQVLTMNVLFGSFYAASILFGGFVTLVF